LFFALGELYKIRFQAVLSLPTPDGLIVSYVLKGVASAPSPAGHITREILCKVQHVENLPVMNWLQVKQQFHVSTSVNGHVSPKNLFLVGGNALIEVPPKSSRIYNWTITPINEGPLELKVCWQRVTKNIIVRCFQVTFTNKATMEYLFYEVFLKVLPNKHLDSIEFSTCARIPVTKLIKLENPVNVPVEYHMSCAKDALVFEKIVTLEPHSVVPEFLACCRFGF
jgi:hydrocephalus-inducing protein